MNDSDLRLPPLSILLVEDDEASRQRVEAFLREDGHSVHTCSDGGAAVGALQANEFDVILMATRLPGMDGLGVARRIRALPNRRKARIPIVALSPSRSSSDVANCRKAGVNDIIGKPLGKDLLHRTLVDLFALPVEDASAEPPSVGLSPGLIDAERIRLLAEAIEPARLLSLLDVAHRSLSESADQLRRDWHAGDGAAVAKTAHRLAGVAANFGCAALGQLAVTIETDCRKGGDGQHLAQAFDRLMVASLAALRNFFR